jgi:hypothetical protein
VTLDFPLAPEFFSMLLIFKDQGMDLQTQKAIKRMNVVVSIGKPV